MAINGLSSIDAVSPSISRIGANEGKKDENIIATFGDYLNEAIKQVSRLENESKMIAEDFAAGKTDNIHQVMIAGQKADIALQFTMQIRNKILDAYNEIMRIQI
ncbi:MAG: flagellar hook-basal body complex protein FliE [Bacillota bacterium]